GVIVCLCGDLPLRIGELTSTEARFALVDASSWRPVWRLRQLRPAGVARYVAGVAALTGGDFLAAPVGYPPHFTGSIASVWPPVGLAVAVLYLGGLRWWPGVVIGDLLSSEGGPLATELVITTANLAEATVATVLLWRLLGRRAGLDRLDQIGRMLIAIAPAT